jgi:hypothetical protein
LRQNQRDIPHLPSSAMAESLRLDAPGLQPGWILDLLSRNVEMVEIIPTPLPNDPQLAMLASGAGEFWTVPVATFKFVQLRLSSDGDPTCVPDRELHQQIRTRLRRQPFRPDTCLAMAFSSISEARFRIQYAAHPRGAPTGRWELFDSSRSVILGSLSTVDDPQKPARTSSFKGQANAPFATLAALVDNRDAPRRPPFRLYHARPVRATPPPVPPEWLPADTPAVTGTFHIRPYTEPETRALFRTDWAKAVEEADRTGWGHADSNALLDQRNGTLIHLTFEDGSASNAIVAADKGFYVTGPWRPDTPIWLSRYDAGGQLEWVVVVHVPDLPSKFGPCGQVVLEASSEHLTLARNCDFGGAQAKPRPMTYTVGRIDIDRKQLAEAVRMRP